MRYQVSLGGVVCGDFPRKDYADLFTYHLSRVSGGIQAVMVKVPEATDSVYLLSVTSYRGDDFQMAYDCWADAAEYVAELAQLTLRDNLWLDDDQAEYEDLGDYINEPGYFYLVDEIRCEIAEIDRQSS